MIPIPIQTIPIPIPVLVLKPKNMLCTDTQGARCPGTRIVLLVTEMKLKTDTLKGGYQIVNCVSTSQFFYFLQLNYLHTLQSCMRFIRDAQDLK